jgi:TonB family protein
MRNTVNMGTRGLGRWLICLALAIAGPQLAYADFASAYKNYREGKFVEAAAMFKDLAELGEGASQFNYGVMHVRGEGMDKNQGVGLGWMLAAHDNGYTQMTAEKLAEFKSKLTPEQSTQADQIVATYGRRALERDLLPGRLTMRCRNLQFARVEQRARAHYPISALRERRDGIVVMSLTVGVDGLARDPHVLVGVPDNDFDDATIDAFLKSRFNPAMRNGEKIESRVMFHFTFFLEQGGDLWKLSAIKKVREAAEQKNPNAQYIMGMIGAMDPTLNVPRDEAHAMLIAAAQAGHPNAQYWAAQRVRDEELCGQTNRIETWLQHAAKGGDSGAQIELARYRIARNANELNVDEIKELVTKAAASQNPYAMKHAIAMASYSSVEALRDPSLALSTAERLKKHDDNLDPHVEEAIAAAYAINQNFKEAKKFQERAVKKADKLYWNTQLMEERLSSYTAGKLGAPGDLFAVPPATTPPPPVKDEGIDCSKRPGGCQRKPDEPRTPTGSFIRE